MPSNVTLSRSLLARALVTVGYPNPDDPGDPFGPYGPHGPVIHALERVALNPQPLPPRAALALVGRRADLVPGHLARAIVGHALSTYQLAEFVGPAQLERATSTIASQLSDLVDDWCPTKPRPWHHGPRAEGVRLLLLGAEFQAAADALGSKHGLVPAFASAAERLLQTGLHRLEESA